MAETDTIIIITGESDYNVLDYIARRAGDIWLQAGWKVIFIDFADVNLWSSQLQAALNADARMVFTCNPDLLESALIPGRKLYDLFSAPTIACLPRHPAHYLDVLMPRNARMIPVTCDRTHQEFIQRLYNSDENNLTDPSPKMTPAFLPFPGLATEVDPADDKPDEQRPIPLFFAGSLDDPRKFRERWRMHLPGIQAALLDQVAEHCARNDGIVLDQMLETAWRRINELFFSDLQNLAFCYKALEGYVVHFRRLVTLQTMVEAGLPIRIHCDKPELIEVPAGYPAIVEPALDFSSTLDISRQATLTLSIMPSMHGGMSERIPTAMLNGSVVISERHNWLAREFPDDRMAAYYPGSEPEKAVEAIARLLRRNRRRMAIAAAARNRVRERYSISNFTTELLALADRWHAAAGTRGGG